jgi:demethylmenaquinone methyltransferase/2-methoxy-6-polyprenyl-1,4-benzoquinol methylase
MVDPVAAASPGRVLDVASGTAGVAVQLAARTTADVTGLDLTEAMLRRGQRNIDAKGLRRRVHLTVGRGEQLPFPDHSFDALTFTYLLRYVDDPRATVGELARVVKPGGVIASLEFLAPPNRIWRMAWWCYTRLLLPAAGWVTGGVEWFRVGRFLGPSISNHYRRYPMSSVVAMWDRAGIDDVHVRVMSLGGGLVMWGTRRGG